jgi:hypothetical protein
MTRGRNFREVEEKPHKSLVIIWIVVLAELGFDLGTTVIAFQYMLEDSDCREEEISLSPVPTSVAFSFIFLISLC